MALMNVTVMYTMHQACTRAQHTRTFAPVLHVPTHALAYTHAHTRTHTHTHTHAHTQHEYFGHYALLEKEQDKRQFSAICAEASELLWLSKRCAH